MGLAEILVRETEKLDRQGLLEGTRGQRLLGSFQYPYAVCMLPDSGVLYIVASVH